MLFWKERKKSDRSFALLQWLTKWAIALSLFIKERMSEIERAIDRSIALLKKAEMSDEQMSDEQMPNPQESFVVDH